MSGTGAKPPRAGVHATRRARVGALVGDGALIITGGELVTRSNDTEFPFRPNSDFHYLTGLAEPGAVLVFRPGRDPQTTLFVRPRDEEAEIWSGRRVGPQGAMELHGADAAHPLEELDKRLPDLLEGIGSLHLPFHESLGRTSPLALALRRALAHLRRHDRQGKQTPTTVVDSRAVMGEERLIKDEAALASLTRAADLTTAAHVAAMAATRPGVHEYEIEALLAYLWRRAGSTGPGYSSIVGSGSNATILHYVANESVLADGEILLVDAGAEWDYFSADLTRSYPVSGRFTPEQRDLYDIVLAANVAGIEASVAGSNINKIHDLCLEILADGLRELKFVDGSRDEVIETGSYKRYYPHRTSHWLGVDVHDAGTYCVGGKPRPLAIGHVLTVEPALYVPVGDERAPKALHGTGIRIEDDVLVTDAGPTVLTAAAPKTPDELEAMIGSGSFPTLAT